jgi:uncharacterized protein (TIGR03435 family)
MSKVVAGMAFALAAGSWAQTPPAFEVASIRQSQEARRGPFENIQVTPGTLTMRAVRFRTAVAWAYGVKDFQVTGPDWMDELGFDIVAKSVEPSEAAELRRMLRALLADRFKLEVRQETRETPAWVVTIGTNGLPPGIKESIDDGDFQVQPNLAKGEVSVKRAPVNQLVEILAKVLRGPVVDETGLTGRYDATVNFMKYLPDGSTPIDVQALAIRAIQQELGLKIDHRKANLPFVIVLRVEKAPVEN